MSYKSIIIALALLGAGLTAGAQTGNNGSAGQNATATNKPHKVRPLVTTKIGLLTRTYGDSIVLRWTAEDYVSWKYLAQTGVNILRVPKAAAAAPGASSAATVPGASSAATVPGASPSGPSSRPRPMRIDTLAYALKPLTLEQFRSRFPESDSLALVPQGVLYGDAENRKSGREGSPGRAMEYNSEQDISFAFAMMVAEWRPDLAEAMAVRFTDRTAQPGMTYDYYVQPTVWDNGGRLLFEPGVAEDVENRPYEPRLYTVQLSDSLSTPGVLTLRWHDALHSSYEAERRFVSDTRGIRYDDAPWERVNKKPYVSMVEQDDDGDLCMLVDSVPQFGVWEYRLRAYDAFATLTEPSPVHRVVVYDSQPPSPPELKHIVIERPEQDPMAMVKAHVVWTKHDIEPDLAGYCINYSNARLTGGEWRTLNNDMIPPSDTTFTIDATHLTTGLLCISAFDDSGNESRSLVQEIRLQDYNPPAAPDSLRAEIVMPRPDSLAAMNQKYAYAILRWKPLPDDDINYYDIAFANDTTHQFIIRNEGGIRETSFIDSLALNANQKFVYYKVRAIDQSTNIGPWSHWLQVKRPHVTPPTQPHLDKSSHNDTTGMHMEWIVGMDADMDYHVVYRRTGDDGPWEVKGRYDADSLARNDYRIVVDDNPPYDRERRYYYYVESFNASPFASKSLAVSWLHRGPKVWPVSIELAGDYMKKEQHTRLVWQAGKLPFDAPYYWCVYRKGPDDKNFQFVVSLPSEQTEYTDELLEPGRQAAYYVMIQWRDGRQSTLSNEVSVRRAADATPNNE